MIKIINCIASVSLLITVASCSTLTFDERSSSNGDDINEYRINESENIPQDVDKDRDQDKVSSESNETEVWNAWELVDFDMEEMEELQEQVDQGHRVGLLDPFDVGVRFITEHYKELGNIKQVQDVSDESGKMLRYTFENRCKIDIRLTKPIKGSNTGI